MLILVRKLKLGIEYEEIVYNVWLHNLITVDLIILKNVQLSISQQ